MKQIQHIMDKYLVKKRSSLTSVVLTSAVLLSVVLSGCVTQDYSNDKTPVVKNQANRNDMAATRVSLGLGYLKMGNMAQAKQNLEKAKNFAPDMVQVYTAFAHYYETVGEHKLTVESYEKALSIKSDDADTLNNYGVYLCRQDQVEAAEKQFLKAIAVPSYILVSKSYENLSSCFLQNDDFSKAEMYLNKAILHSPNSATTLFQMVRLQYAMGDYQQAKLFEQRFEKVTRRFTAESLALAYKVYLKLGERSTAKNYGAMLVKMYPQSWESQQYLLNELELIEADNLAKRYQLTQIVKESEKSKKRIVKLSPRKNKTTQNKPKIETNEQSVINETKDNLTETEKLPVLTASSASINNALTSPVTEPETGNALVITEERLTEEAITAEVIEAETLNTETVMKEHAADQIAPAALLTTEKETISEPLTEENNSDEHVFSSEDTTTETAKVLTERIVVAADVVVENTEQNQEATNAAKTVTNSAAVTDEEISLADSEIIFVAKKPKPIIEENLEENIENTNKEPDSETVNEVEDKQLITEPIQNEAESIITEDSSIVEVTTEKKPRVHVVAAGDTLYAISVKYNIKLNTLRRWNNISKNSKIRVKDTILLEDPQSVNK